MEVELTVLVCLLHMMTSREHFGTGPIQTVTDYITNLSVQDGEENQPTDVLSTSCYRMDMENEYQDVQETCKPDEMIKNQQDEQRVENAHTVEDATQPSGNGVVSVNAVSPRDDSKVCNPNTTTENQISEPSKQTNESVKQSTAVQIPQTSSRNIGQHDDQTDGNKPSGSGSPLNKGGQGALNVYGGKLRIKGQLSIHGSPSSPSLEPLDGQSGAGSLGASQSGSINIYDGSVVIGCGSNVVIGLPGTNHPIQSTTHAVRGERLDVTDSFPSALNNSGGFGQQFKKENDDTLCQSMVEALHDQMKSVGVLIYKGSRKGTVFRVGTNRVMTAFHVVKDILDPSLLTGDKTFINFNESASDPPVMMYRIKEHAILNKQLDVAVLEISNPSNLPKKMALRKPKSSETGVTNVSLIGYGHTTHDKKCLDPKCEILSPNAQRIISALASLQQKSGYYKTAMQQTLHNPNLVDSGYEGYDHPTKTIFDCFMEHGGSGAPAVTNDNQRAIEVVAMLTNGLPKFYFYLPPQLQTDFPKEYRLELGTNMTSIYEWIKDTQPESLLKDLFN